MRSVQLPFAKSWLFIIPELMLAIFLCIRFFSKDTDKKNRYPLLLITLLLIDNFTTGWINELLKQLVINISMLMLIAVFMLVPVFRKKKKRAIVIPLFDRTPEEIFIRNCKEYQLSLREIQIADLVLKGYKNKKMGEVLFIAEKTVDTHLRNIYDKVGMRGKLELVIRLSK
jgi:DNA-binding CsgD family transcriptional regulator